MKKILLSCLLMISMAFNAQIELGINSTDVGEAPISTFYGYSYVQQIFTKQEINTNAAGNITGLKFYLDPSMSISNSSDWVVYLGHTSKTTFSSEADWIPLAQLTQVYAGTVTNTNGVVEITFAVPFPYNNTQNLVVAAEDNASGYDLNSFEEVFYVYGATPGSSICFKNDSIDPDPSNPPSGDLNNYRSAVSILGLTPSAIPACPSITYPINNSTLIPTSPSVTWYAPQGATSYKVSIGTTPGGTDVINQQSVATAGFTPSQALAANTTYYLRVVSVGIGGESSGCSEVIFQTIPPPPSNDACSGAIAASVFPYAYTQSDASGATNNNGFITICSNDMNDGTWFTFTGDGTTFDITVSMPSGSVFDAQVGVYSGSCSNLACEDTVDDEGEGGTETLSIPTVSGTVYYVNVGHYSGSDDELEWPFTINITKGVLATSEITKAKNQISLYPNPVSEVLNISNASKVKSISISDLSGRLVKTVDHPDSSIQVGGLKQGVYMVMVTMKDGSKQNIKIIKK